MKKELVVFVLLLGMAISFASASNLTVDKIDKGSVIISELKNPAVFEFTINNSGASDWFEIYSLIGVSMGPKGKFELLPGNNTLEVMAFPNKEIRKRGGYYNFEYQIKGSGDDLFKDTLTVKIVGLEEAVKIIPQSIHYGDDSATISVENVQNTRIDDMKISFRSAFFEGEKQVSLKPFEQITVLLNVDEGKIKTLVAGPYVVSSDVVLADAKVGIESVVNYLERQNTSIVKTTKGFFVRASEIKKRNEGNVNVVDRIEVQKNIFTRLFTSNSVEPLSTDRKGVFVTYTWEKDLRPSESWVITTTTNYTLPFVFILLILFAALMTYIYSRTNVVLTKRVSYVRTRGDKFALKVRLHLKTRKPVENVVITDRVPMAMKLYDKAGIMPHRIDAATRRIMWNIDKLSSGEERIFSYIIYSETLKPIGKFELPSATVSFNREGKNKIVPSNKTFFISETHARL